MGITLYRHGLTAENERKAYIGWSDPPLSDTGREATSKWRKSLRLEAYFSQTELVYTSDLTRCIETATILFPQLQSQSMQGLRELHFGAWDGKTYQDLQHDPAYQAWLNDPFTGGPPLGEKWEQFAGRISTAFNSICRKMEQHDVKEVGIITHGGVIRYLLSEMVASHHSFYDWDVSMHKGHRLVWNTADWRRGRTCTSYQEVPIREKEHG